MTGRSPEPSLLLLGVDHRDLPVQARRQVAWDSERTEEVLGRFARRQPGSGLLVLVTCTRTELYVEAVHGHGEAVHQVLETDSGVAGCPALRGLWFELAGIGAVRHLFRVATGLQSPILGDTQVAGQIRSAVDAARAGGTLSPLLAELARHALSLGRSARRETSISHGGADIGTVAVETARRRLGLGVDGRPVVVIGAGQAARSVIGALRASGVGPVVVVNRTTTVELGQDGPVRDPVALPALLVRAGVVFSTVPAAAAVLDDDVLAVARRTNPDLGVVDLAGISGLEVGDNRVIGLGDLIDHPTPGRLAALPVVEELCDRASRDWEEWLQKRPLDRAIGQLYRDLAGLDPPLGLRERRAVNEVLHHHVDRLRRLQVRASGPTRGEGSQRSLSAAHEF